MEKKKLNGKVPRKRFSKDCDAKKGKWIPFQTATTTAAAKKLNLAMLRFAFVHFLPCSSEVGF